MGRHPLDGGRRKRDRDAGPCRGGNEESELGPPEAELEAALDMSTQITHITVLALSPCLLRLHPRNSNAPGMWS